MFSKPHIGSHTYLYVSQIVSQTYSSLDCNETWTQTYRTINWHKQRENSMFIGKDMSLRM